MITDDEINNCRERILSAFEMYDADEFTRNAIWRDTLTIVRAVYELKCELSRVLFEGANGKGRNAIPAP